MHLRNELRLLAGIAIDPTLEVTVKKAPEKLTESGWSSQEVVTNLDDAYSRLQSAVQRRDKHAIASISAELEELEASQDEYDAGMREGCGGEYEEETIDVPCPECGGRGQHTRGYYGDEREDCDECGGSGRLTEPQYMESTINRYKQLAGLEEGKSKKAKKDWDGNGKVESEEAEHKGVVDKAINKKKGKKKEKVTEAAEHFTGWNEWEQAVSYLTHGFVRYEDETDGRVKAIVEVGGGFDQEKTVGIWDDDKGEGLVYESTLNFAQSNDVSWEDDESEPVNVSGQDAQNDNTVWEPLDSDKNESPHQLCALGNQSSEEKDRTITIPAKLLTQLKDVVTEARAEADKTRNSYSRYETTKFYDDYANACEQLHDHLKGGTVGDMKNAQIHMSSLMGPMLHKIPDDVNDFVMRGGQNRSLKDHFFKVQGYPIEGPRNKLS